MTKQDIINRAIWLADVVSEEATEEINSFRDEDGLSEDYRNCRAIFKKHFANLIAQIENIKEEVLESEFKEKRTAS